MRVLCECRRQTDSVEPISTHGANGVLHRQLSPSVSCFRRPLLMWVHKRVLVFCLQSLRGSEISNSHTCVSVRARTRVCTCVHSWTSNERASYSRISGKKKSVRKYLLTTTSYVQRNTTDTGVSFTVNLLAQELFFFNCSTSYIKKCE